MCRESAGFQLSYASRIKARPHAMSSRSRCAANSDCHSPSCSKVEGCCKQGFQEYENHTGPPAPYVCIAVLRQSGSHVIHFGQDGKAAALDASSSHAVAGPDAPTVAAPAFTHIGRFSCNMSNHIKLRSHFAYLPSYWISPAKTDPMAWRWKTMHLHMRSSGGS
jgi:hypothetical protein